MPRRRATHSTSSSSLAPPSLSRSKSSSSWLSFSSTSSTKPRRSLCMGSLLMLTLLLIGMIHLISAEDVLPNSGSGDGSIVFFRADNFGEDAFPALGEEGGKGEGGKMAAGVADPEVDESDIPILGFWPAFFNSLSMILVTELGDKTFFIAAVLAMRYDRLLIFGGAIGALILMTILSAAIGNVLPNVLPRKYTHYASALLFLYFGIKLLMEARGMEGSGPSDELHEVEEELLHKKEDVCHSPHLTEMTHLENGSSSYNSNSSNHNNNSGSSSSEGGREGGREERSRSPLGGSHGRQGSFHQENNKGKGGGATKVFTQALTLTFLAEWGDRSQIATIALAAAKDPFGVTAGGILGHSLCTGLAVVGGRMLAARISEKTVASTGGALFLVFCLHSLLVGP